MLIIGGLSWLLIGLFRFDLVAIIFGNFSFFSRLIYIVVGLAAIYLLLTVSRYAKK
jgi:uncharacterized membrane protein YuzA (DUF378 family)